MTDLPFRIAAELRYRAWMASLRVVARALLRAGYRVKVEGRERVPREGGVLVVANHVAFHDWLFVGAALQRPARFVMHQHHFQYPALRAFFEASRVIPIAPRKQDAARLDEALRAIDDALAHGELVVVFPEGRMTDDGHLSELRPGVERIVAARLAAGQRVPVIPIGIQGLFGSFFSRAHGEPMSHRPERFRAPVRLTFGAPIAPESVSIEALRDALSTLVGEPHSTMCDAVADAKPASDAKRPVEAPDPP